MKDKFNINIESLHLADRGTELNPHEIPLTVLRQREVIYIDIANDPIEPQDYKEIEDPSKFRSEKTLRGPLTDDWMKTCEPVMTCYKLITCNFQWFGLQTKVENLIQTSERRILTNFHRQLFCWTDRWYGLSMCDIRAIEEETKLFLDNQRSVGTVRGLQP